MSSIFLGLLILINFKKYLYKFKFKIFIFTFINFNFLLTESYTHNGKLINEVDHDKQYDNKADC